jgi:hypothetical protein
VLPFSSRYHTLKRTLLIVGRAYTLVVSQYIIEKFVLAGLVEVTEQTIEVTFIIDPLREDVLSQIVPIYLYEHRQGIWKVITEVNPVCNSGLVIHTFRV